MGQVSLEFEMQIYTTHVVQGYFLQRVLVNAISGIVKVSTDPFWRATPKFQYTYSSTGKILLKVSP